MTTLAHNALRYALGCALTLAAAGAAMLLLGMAHAQDDRVPDLGFTVSLYVVVAVFAVLKAERLLDSLSEEDES